MSALDYLRPLPALWLNLDRSPHRAEQFEKLTAPLFDHIWRVSAYDGVSDYDPDTAAFQWRDAVLDTVANKDDRQVWTTVHNFQAGDKYLKSQRAQRINYACTMALFYSTFKCMQIALDAGWERFILLEDDAVPRTAALSRLGAPEPMHMNVWGGAIPMAGHKSDRVAFNSGKKIGWVPLPTGKKTDKLYTTAAYELSREAAQYYVDTLQHRPLPVDIAWWAAMDVLGGQRLVPTGFIQIGNSDRSGSTKRPSSAEAAEAEATASTT